MPHPGVCMNIINARHLKDGNGIVTNPQKFLDQDFEQLKQYCMIKRVRYIDDMFPPDARSIGTGLLEADDLKRVVWLRPHKMVPNPMFEVDGVSRFDFGQGMLGNCWFLASIGALTFQDFILRQVVPPQTFNEEYCGIFHFRFWRFGRWVDVVIDDKLPTIDGRLVFVHSKDPTEFWPALLEKAYAKVCGSYLDMNAGTPAEALVDFTGGVHMCIDLTEPPPHLWELMCRAGQSKSLMGCGTPQGATSANTVLPNGIVQGHAYTVTGVKQMTSQGQPVHLVRLWNPWGEKEWIGDWSDKSPLWQTVSPQEREMFLSVADNGEFWMTLEDFCRFYSDLDICCLCPDFLDGNTSCHWKTSFYEGRWVAGTTAGGCMNNLDLFWTNPQYRVKIDEVLSECSGKQGEKNMLVSLMQKPDKRNRRLVQSLHIGFSVFEVTEEYKSLKGKFPASFFNKNRPVYQTKTYANAREVMGFLMLKPGEYLIVPSTFNPNETASFILTILSKSETHVHENSDGHDHEQEEAMEEDKGTENEENDEKKKIFFRQYSDKYEEVDAEQLQRLLNENILKGDMKSGGFSIDACRSMVALMDTSVTGKLNGEEFIRLWKRVVTYKDIFFRTDVSKTGTLLLSELRNAVMASGKRVSDDMLNLLALRYGASSGHITLESFISMVLRFDCMSQIFGQLSNGMNMTLLESEWMYLSMYT
ncbi:calpain-1 catalytic subunit-like [Trematomus bernacchii]|uniref:calpain-1 catalytic subunit-like n=1 Tax=Trematomus bernacchii TaxID=40690 RepID=UPI00146A16A3|nr:calpain-1 catalytic subunit-like [Trematomus bernacchii]XP_033991123.1 calpain-1 catalytic subunit-like [Trematomus bernacchii]